MLDRDLLLQVRLLFSSGAASADLRRLQTDIVKLRSNLTQLQNVSLTRVGNELSLLRQKLASVKNLDLSSFNKQLTELASQQGLLRGQTIPIRLAIAGAKLDQQAIVQSKIVPQLSAINTLLNHRSALETKDLFLNQQGSKLKQQNLLREKASLLSLQSAYAKMSEAQRSAISPGNTETQGALQQKMIEAQRLKVMTAQAEAYTAQASVIGSQYAIAAKTNEIAKSKEKIRLSQEEISAIDRENVARQAKIASYKASEAAIAHDITLTRQQKAEAIAANQSRIHAVQQEIVAAQASRSAILQQIQSGRSQIAQWQSQAGLIRIMTAGYRNFALGLVGLRDTVTNIIGSFGNLAKVMSGIMLLDFSARAVESFFSLNSQIENLHRGLNALFGVNLGQSYFQQLTQLADEYGTKIQSTSQQFMELQAAAKGTSMEGKPVMEVYAGMSANLAVLGSSAERTQRALMAVTQMLSKGKIYAEEMRQQLSEQLPGALQMFAKAVNIQPDALLAAMSKGQVGVEALLPFARLQLKEFGELAKATSTFTQRVNRLSNSLIFLNTTLGEQGAWDAFKELVTGVDGWVRRITESIPAMVAAISAEWTALSQLLRTDLWWEPIKTGLGELIDVLGQVSSALPDAPFQIESYFERVIARAQSAINTLNEYLIVQAKINLAQNTDPGNAVVMNATANGLGWLQQGFVTSLTMMEKTARQSVENIGRSLGMLGDELIESGHRIEQQFNAAIQPLSFEKWFKAPNVEAYLDPITAAVLKKLQDAVWLEGRQIKDLPFSQQASATRPAEERLQEYLRSADYLHALTAAQTAQQAELNRKLQEYQTYLSSVTASIKEYNQATQYVQPDTLGDRLLRERDAIIAERELYRLQNEAAKQRDIWAAEDEKTARDAYKTKEALTKAEAALTDKQFKKEIKLQNDLYEARRANIQAAIAAGYGAYGVERYRAQQASNPDQAALNTLDMMEQSRLAYAEWKLANQDISSANEDQTKLILEQRKALLDAAEAVAKRRNDELGLSQLAAKREKLNQDEFDQLAKINSWKKSPVDVKIELAEKTREEFRRTLQALVNESDVMDATLKAGINRTLLRQDLSETVIEIQDKVNSSHLFDILLNARPVFRDETDPLKDLGQPFQQSFQNAPPVEVPVKVSFFDNQSIGEMMLQQASPVDVTSVGPLNAYVATLGQLQTVLEQLKAGQTFESLVFNLSAIDRTLPEGSEQLKDFMGFWREYAHEWQRPKSGLGNPVSAEAQQNLDTFIRRVAELNNATQVTEGAWTATGQALQTVQQQAQQALTPITSIVQSANKPIVYTFEGDNLEALQAKVSTLINNLGKSAKIDIAQSEINGVNPDGSIQGKQFAIKVTVTPDANDVQQKVAAMPPLEVPAQLKPITEVKGDKALIADNVMSATAEQAKTLGQLSHDQLMAGLKEQGVTIDLSNATVTDSTDQLANEARRLVATGPGLSFPIAGFATTAKTWDDLAVEGNRYLRMKAAVELGALDPASVNDQIQRLNKDGQWQRIESPMDAKLEDADAKLKAFREAQAQQHLKVIVDAIPGQGWAFNGQFFKEGEGFARGGLVGGVGSGDTVPAWLTPGEFVMNRQAVAQAGLANLTAMNRGMGKPTVPYYASGGPVTSGGMMTLNINVNGRTSTVYGAHDQVHQLANALSAIARAR